MKKKFESNTFLAALLVNGFRYLFFIIAAFGILGAIYVIMLTLYSLFLVAVDVGH